MLKTLSIRNYALIENLEVEFERGLNIITGETGAGKSIIIDALGLILGSRPDASAVRAGTEKAVVEGIFEIAQHKPIASLLASHDFESGPELIMRREISAKGQSRCFLNDSPAPLAVLTAVGDLLVDLHGQHDHQSLLRVETHVDLLDGFGGLEGLVDEFQDAQQKVAEVVRHIEMLVAKESELTARRDLYEFQIHEIDAIAPVEGEEEQLHSEVRILENAERLFGITERLYQLLYEGENSIHDQLVLVRNQLEDLVSIDGTFGEPTKEAASATAIVSELAKYIQRYNSKIDFSPERLDELRERLGKLSLLKKKYGGSLEEVLRHRAEIGAACALAENFTEELESLEREYVRRRGVCSEIAERLSTKRREISRRVDNAIVAGLKSLGIANALFETQITHVPEPKITRPAVVLGSTAYATTSKGIDRVEFLISTNAGERVKPLAKVASGGEISRIMLAMKMILAKSDRLPLLVFDEIDAGISGRIAQVVGKAMRTLSQFHQVIAITHLPQIAGLADAHFSVEKIESKKRTFTQAKKLGVEERVEEVARLMSGLEVTDAGLKGARELMGLR